MNIKSYPPQLVCPGLMEALCTKVLGALLTEENDRHTGLTCAISGIIDFANPMFEFGVSKLHFKKTQE